MEFHPASNIFPMMDDKEFPLLVSDIKTNGLQEPILIDGDKRIIDGRNRYLACLQAGVDPRFIVWEGAGDPTPLVISLNLLRRHLSDDQRAYIAGKYLLPAEEAKARERQLAAQNNDAGRAVQEKLPEQGSGQARDLAAAQVGLSGKTVDAAARAIENGIPALEAALAEGRVTASLAAKISRLDPDLQESILGDDNPKRAYREACGQAQADNTSGEVKRLILRLKADRSALLEIRTIIDAMLKEL